MKKYLVIGVLCCIILTACGKTETLTCTKVSTEDGMELSEEIVMTFVNNTVDKLSMVQIYNTDSEQTATTMKSYLDLSVSMLEEMGYKTNITQDKEKITFTANAQVKDLKNNEDFVDTFEFDLDDSFADVKEEYQEEGYTCK